MNFKELKELFTTLGITEFGIVSPKDASPAIADNNTVFYYGNRIDTIEDILPDAKSIIVFLVPYNHGVEPANLSMYATGMDYHKVCKKISDAVSVKLAKEGFSCASYADSGPLRERTLASLAGLGIIGENAFLINERYGSYTFIGYIVTTCLFPPASPSEGECIKCGKCKKSCPGGALNGAGFAEGKCISYLTQKKGELTQSEAELIKLGKSAWGCDICQKVCPMNDNRHLTELKEFKEDLILCIENEYLSNREFKKKYSSRAFSWRGKSVIDRNLSILTDKKG